MSVNDFLSRILHASSPAIRRRGRRQGVLTTTVEGHAAGAGKVMLLKTTLVDKLLSSNVASGKENSCGDALGEQRARGEAGVVPVGI